MWSDAESATEMLPLARARDDVSQVVAAHVAKLVVASCHVEMSFGFLEMHHSTCEKGDRMQACGSQQARLTADEQGSHAGQLSRVWIEPVARTAGMRDASSTAVADPKMTFPLDS